MKRFAHMSSKELYAVISGVLLTAAFPKIELWWVAWFALVPLLFSLKDQSPRKSFRLGFIAGIFHYLTLMYWLAYTMHTYGRLPWSLSVPVLFLLACYLALYIAAFSYAISFLCRTPNMLILVVPIAWVSLEYVRAKLFSGLPWELMGYSQHSLLPVVQFSEISGVYGVSFLIVFANAAIFLIFLSLFNKRWHGIQVSRRFSGISVLSFVLMVGCAWVYGVHRIQEIDRQIAAAPSVRVAVIQGNIDQAIKWDLRFQEASTEKYIRLSQETQKYNPDLIIWPETATPFYFLHEKELSVKVFQGIQNTRAEYLIGSPSIRRRGKSVHYFNSAYLIHPEGKLYGKYNKAHLVPFGEYVPFKKWLPFLGKMVAHVGDFQPGRAGHVIAWGDHELGVQICFEIIFPALSRAMVKNQAALLVNITNDAWFGKSSAPYQHFSMTTFRAVENRRSIARSANTGISGFIDPAGRVSASTSLFEEATLTQTIPLLDTVSFYTRFGDLFALICVAAGIVIVILRLTVKCVT